MRKEICAIYSGVGLFAGACLSQLRENNSASHLAKDSGIGLMIGAALGGAAIFYNYMTRTEEQARIIAANHSMENYLKQTKRKPTPEEQLIKDLLNKLGDNQDKIPDDFICPIGRMLMIDPVKLPDGKNYSRYEIYKWYIHGQRTCPLIPSIQFTQDPIEMPTNKALQGEIVRFLEEELATVHASVSPV